MINLEIEQIKLRILSFQRDCEFNLLCLELYRNWMEKIANEDPRGVFAPDFKECRDYWEGAYEDLEEALEAIIAWQQKLNELEAKNHD